MRKMQVLGIGSPYGNDRVGWYVADRLQQASALTPWRSDRLTITTLDRPGVALLNYFTLADEVIIVDAMLGQGESGTIERFDRDSLPSWHTLMSTHGMGLSDTVRLAEALDVLPERLLIYGIEIGRCETEGDLELRVKTAAQRLVTQIIQTIIAASV